MKATQPILLAVLIFAFACGSEKTEQAVTTISGKIINPKGETIRFGYNDESTEATLDSTGTFTATIDIEKAADIRFSHGGEYGALYLRPGDNISMSLNTEEFDETLKFEGGAAAINNYKAALVLLDDSLMSFKDLMMLEEAAFLKAADSLEDMKIAIMANFDISDEEFIKFFKDGLKFSTARNKLRYPDYHPHYTGLDSFEVSETFFAFKEAIDINDTSMLDNSAFMSYIETMVSNQASEKYTALPEEEQSPNTYYTFEFEAAKELIEAKPVQRDFLYENIYRGFTYMQDDIRNEMISYWKTLNPKSDQVTKMDDKATQWAELAPGKPAPDFSFASIDGDTLTMKDFEGKLVYIDVWATWCGPCIREQPHYEKLVEKFEGQDVVFLAISIDSTPEPWVKMVQKRELKGVHLYAPGAWNSTITKDYMIAGIPRYILIGKDGNIISANATRPSGDIGEEIEGLLGESV